MSTHDLTQLVKEIQAGASPDDVARRAGITYNGLRMRLLRAGLWEKGGLADRLEPFERRHVPTEVEKAYMAGYFDGEGCVRVKENNKNLHEGGTWMVVVSFGQTQIGSIELMYAIYGGSLTYLEARPHRKMKRGKAVYALSQKTAVQAFLSDVLPFLIEKKSQVVAALSIFDQSSTSFAAVRQIAKTVADDKQKEISKKDVENAKGRSEARPSGPTKRNYES